MSESCSKIKASIVFIFALIFFMWSGVVYLKKLSFEETKCDIKNVTYTQSMGDIDNLVSCSCGRRNKCLMGTCITIKGGIYGTNQYWKFLPDTDSNIPADMVKCTFSEDRCYDFDKVDFRIYCENLQEIPDLESAVESLRDIDGEIKETLYDYLKAIAEADGEIAEEELRLLNKVANTWQLSTKLG